MLQQNHRDLSVEACSEISHSLGFLTQCPTAVDTCSPTNWIIMTGECGGKG